MSSVVRASTPADQDAITALFRKAGLRPNAEPQQLHWKYWLEREDFPGPRSFVLCEGPEIIAHAGIVPGNCISTRGRRRLMHLIDWAALPSATGAGVALMKHIGQNVDALLAIGGSKDTLRLLPHLGFRGVGEALIHARPLHPLQILRQRSGTAWKRIPRVIRSGIWNWLAPRARSSEMKFARLGANELDSIAGVFPTPAATGDVIERSVAGLRYFLACPIVQVALFSISQSGRPRGYTLLAYTPGQVRLADCWIDSESPEDWQTLINCAVQAARQWPDAAELITWSSDAQHAANLRACGFHVRMHLPVSLRFRIREAGAATAPIRVQMLDNDAAYHFQGRAQLWA